MTLRTSSLGHLITAAQSYDFVHPITRQTDTCKKQSKHRAVTGTRSSCLIVFSESANDRIEVLGGSDSSAGPEADLHLAVARQLQTLAGSSLGGGTRPATSIARIWKAVPSSRTVRCWPHRSRLDIGTCRGLWCRQGFLRRDPSSASALGVTRRGWLASTKCIPGQALSMFSMPMQESATRERNPLMTYRRADHESGGSLTWRLIED